MGATDQENLPVTVFLSGTRTFAVNRITSYLRLGYSLYPFGVFHSDNFSLKENTVYGFDRRFQDVSHRRGSPHNGECLQGKLLQL